MVDLQREMEDALPFAYRRWWRAWRAWRRAAIAHGRAWMAAGNDPTVLPRFARRERCERCQRRRQLSTVATAGLERYRLCRGCARGWWRVFGSRRRG